jgi:hypothetical protein
VISLRVNNLDVETRFFADFQMEIINNAERLSDVMPVALSLACCGGSLVHHQQEWIAFRKVRFNVFFFADECCCGTGNPSDPRSGMDGNEKNLAVRSRRHVESH